jgi:hypothetical protein
MTERKIIYYEYPGLIPKKMVTSEIIRPGYVKFRCMYRGECYFDVNMPNSKKSHIELRKCHSDYLKEIKYEENLDKAFIKVFGR